MNKKTLVKGTPKKTVAGKFRVGQRLFTTEAGRHTAKDVTLSEVAINSLVLRVHLNESNLKEKPQSVDEQEPTKSLPGESLLKKRLIEKVDTKTAKKSTENEKSEDTLNNNTQKLIKNPASTAGMERSKIGQVNINSVPAASSTPTKVYKYKPVMKGNTTIIKTNELNGSPPKYVLRKQLTNEHEAKFNDVSFKPKVKVTYQPKRKPHETTTIRYCFEYPPSKPFEDRVLNYKFSKLAVDVRSLRLPAPHWKIKIYMRNKAISSIAFTNKQEPERVLKFGAASNEYELIIDNKKAELLGSPMTIDNRQDVECLLDILHNISSDNPMIMYK